MASVKVKYLPEMRILSGLPASGKTREALSWIEGDPTKRIRVNYDDLLLEMFGEGWKWNRKDEDAMQARAFDTANNALRLGLSVIIDNPNLTKNVRERWINLAKQHNAPFEIDEIDTDIWTCIGRDLERKARVGRAVIERLALFNGWIDWDDEKAYSYDGFVICDLDGTLCDIEHRLKHIHSAPKNWDAFFAGVSDDDIHPEVADLLETFANDRMGILLVSGRPIDKCGIATEDWLRKWGIKYDHLFMRQSGDKREDTVIKQEILDLLPIDDIHYAIDDRPSVVRMWKKNGIFTLQVGEGKEF